MDVAEMIATQNPDGSWKNDFLTRRNAAALKVCGDPAAQVAYKKAMRNLRSRGVLWYNPPKKEKRTWKSYSRKTRAAARAA